MANKSNLVGLTKQTVRTPSTIEEFHDLEHLGNFLKDLQSSNSSDAAMAHALSAQIRVLSVVNSPSLSSSVFDLMLDSLKTAIEKARTPEEKQEYQRSAAIMTNSMVFFMEAKLHWESNKWDKEGKELLKQACNLVVDSTNSILQLTMTKKLSAATAINIFSGLIENAGGIFSRFIAWVADQDNFYQKQIEFDSFVFNLVEKLGQYRHIYGKQVILAELITRYESMLLENTYDKKEQLAELNPKNKALKPLPPFKNPYKGFQIALGVLSAVLGLFAVFILYNWFGGDAWLEAFGQSLLFNPLFNFHFGFLEIHFLFKILIIILLLCGSLVSGAYIADLYESSTKAYESQKNKYLNNINQQYYAELVKVYRG